MEGLTLPSSPNWYLSHISDGNVLGTFVFGARHDVFVFKIVAGSIEFLGVFTGHRDRVTSVALGTGFGQTEVCCSTGDDSQVKLWDVKTKSELQSHRDHKVKITALSWSQVQTDLIVTGDERGNVVSWAFNHDSRRHFQLEKDYIYCLACCPHKAAFLAIGYKSGTLLLVDVAAGGRVLHKFRGHTDEVQSVAWCPVAGQHVLSSNHQDDDDTSTGFLLASGSRDKTIRVWGTTEGKQLHSRKLPTNQGYRRDFGDQSRGKVWTAVCWPRSTPHQLISSSVGGDILLWNLQADQEKERQTFQVKNMKSHGRIVFGICVGGADDGTVMSLSLDRTIMFWDFASLTSKFYIPSLGGHVYSVCVSPIDPGYVALGVGDNTIRVWNTSNKNNLFDINTIWQGLKSKVTALAWHPTKEGMLAFGTDDGRVGIFDVLSNKPPKSSSTYHRRTVYVVAWGPPSHASESQASFNLYSVGDSKVLEHFPHAFSTEAIDITSVIASVNNRPNSSGRSDLSWKPDNSAVAIGNEDGSVEVFQVSTFKQMCMIHLHRKLVNSLVWHPQFTAQSPDGSPFSHWLASGASDADVHVVDLTQLFDTDRWLEQPMSISQGMRKLEAHSIRVTGLSWNPHVDGELVSVGYDSMAYVWNVKSGEAMKQFSGHFQRLLCVTWSGIDPDVIFSGGFDSTLQVWNVSTASKVIAGNRNKKRKKKKADFDPAGSSTKQLPSAVTVDSQVRDQVGDQMVPEVEAHRGVWQSHDAREVQELHNLLEKKRRDILLQQQQQQRSDNLAAGSGQSGHTDVEKLTSSVPTASACVSTMTGSQSSGRDKDGLQLADSETSHLTGTDSVTVEDILQSFTGDTVSRDRKRTGRSKDGNSRQSGGFATQLKRKKDRPKSVFPATATKENRGKLGVLEDLLLLTKIQCDEERLKTLPPENFHLGLFSDRKQAYSCLREEGKHHLNHDNMDYYLHLEIWKGNIGGALQVARDREELSDWLVAMAPLASYDTWLAMCGDYAHQLEEDGQYHKAASYLLAAHKVYAAIELFKKHKLFKEAVALAKIRLSPLDPVLEDLYIDWSQQLLKDGNYEQAAKCYLAMKNVLDAAKLLSRRSDQPTLKTATHMTLLANEKQQGFHYAQKVVHQHMVKNEWKEAYRFLRENEVLKVLIPFVSMHELMMREVEGLTLGMFQEVDPACYTDWGDLPDGKAIIPDFILDDSDLDPVLPWKLFLKGKHSFPHHVLRIWYGSLDVAMDTESLGLTYHTLSQLQSARQSHVDPQQLMTQVCMDLTLCLVALLLGETSTAITHLLHIVASLHNCGHFSLMQAICQLILPPGPKYLLKLQQEVTAMRVIISMESNRNVDGSAQPVKRYLSDIKDDGKISNTGLRCRELDCLRGYYYLSVLHCLQERCNNTTTTMTNHLPERVDCQISSDCDRHTDTRLDVTQITSCSAGGKAAASDVSAAKDLNSVACAVSQSKADVCVVDQSKSDSCVGDQSKLDASVAESDFQAKGKQSESTKDVGVCDSSSDSGTNLTSDKAFKSIDEDLDGKADCSLQDGVKQTAKHHVSSGGDASACIQAHDQTKLCVGISHEKTEMFSAEVNCDKTKIMFAEVSRDKIVPMSHDSEPTIMNETKVTLPKLKDLAKGLLWDIQAKKSSLTETLGYIHKAISKHLLTDNTKGTPQSVSSDTPVDLNQGGSTSPPSTDIPSNQSSITSHNARTDTNKVPNQTDDDSVLKSHTNNNVMLNSSRVPVNTSLTNFRRFSEGAVPFCHRKSSLGLSEVEMIALASAEPCPKSRKVLWEDQPRRPCETVDYYSSSSSIHDGGSCVLGGSAVRYINVPDEWYGLPVDEKYFTSYVTMGLLRDEQEYVTHELKRIPDCSQVPFPNPLDSAWLLLKLCSQSGDLREEDRAAFTHDVVLWALHFAMTRRQREELDTLIKTTP
ncbi:gem-associated protein 5-like [Gigantopelta aegis]|uniref:gem-associated protein 5-like n=1 Tax=Gigantopelta aegis TaxID=1735272 RepID=UPI001B88AD86|nr:gem-associated protein 5-like [Gigantopelta aegis]